MKTLPLTITFLLSLLFPTLAAAYFPYHIEMLKRNPEKVYMQLQDPAQEDEQDDWPSWIGRVR